MDGGARHPESVSTMNPDLKAAQSRLASAKARLQVTAGTAKSRFQPRALAADGAEALASRTSRLITRATPTPQWQRIFGVAATLVAIGTAAVLRLKQAQSDTTHAATKPDAVSPVGPSEPFGTE
jgi:hypothetical protein